MVLKGPMVIIDIMALTILHPGFSFQGSWHEADFIFRDFKYWHKKGLAEKNGALARGQEYTIPSQRLEREPLIGWIPIDNVVPKQRVKGWRRHRQSDVSRWFILLDRSRRESIIRIFSHCRVDLSIRLLPAYYGQPIYINLGNPLARYKVICSLWSQFKDKFINPETFPQVKRTKDPNPHGIEGQQHTISPSWPSTYKPSVPPPALL